VNRLFLFTALSCALSAAPAGAEEGSPLKLAEERFLALKSYTARVASYAGGDEHIDYTYKAPGFIRMDFIRPHKGAILVYDPEKKMVRIRPFGFMKFLVLNLKPTDRLIRSRRGHTVDRSHLGALIENALEVEASGGSRVLDTVTEDGKQALRLEVTGKEGFESLGVNRYLLWLDAGTYLPLRAEAYDAKGELIEGVRMEDLVLDPELEDSVFAL
jgi:outer membrane lipoprotein-sorting protein